MDVEVKVGDRFVDQYGLPFRVIGREDDVVEILWFRFDWPDGRCPEFGRMARWVREDLAAGKLKRRT